MGGVTAVSRSTGLRARARDRGGARHDVSRQHVPGGQLGVERAVRAARGRRAVGGARPDVRHARRRRQRRARPIVSRTGCWATRSRRWASITVLGIVFAPLLARLLSSGAPNAQVGAEQRHLATFLLWFFVPQVVLYAFGAIATGLLYAKRQVRDHGRRADGQQRRDGRVLRHRSGCWPDPIPAST